MKEVVKQCAESLSAHVMLALKMIERVKDWKDHVKKHLNEGEFNPMFKYYDSDIYETFKTSCDFLPESCIANLFPVNKSDPFLLAIIKELPTIKIKNKKKQLSQIIILEKSKAFLLMPREIIDRVNKIFYEIGKNENFKKLISLTQNSCAILPKASSTNQLTKESDSVYLLFTARIIKQAQANILKEAIFESINDYIAQNILNKYLNHVTDSLKQIANEAIQDAHDSISSGKAKNLMISNMIEGIFRNLLECEINHLELDGFCEKILEDALIEKANLARSPEVKRRFTQIFEKIGSGKLIELLFQDIIEEFVNED